MQQPTKAYPREKVTSALLLAWWLGVLDVVPLPGSSATAITDAVTGGSLRRTILGLSFAIIGGIYLPAGLRHHGRRARTSLVLLACYSAWALATLFWSQAPHLTFRRLVLFGCLVLGAMGLGLGYYGHRPDGRRLLVRDTVAAGGLAAAVVWLPTLASGSINLLAPDWSLLAAGVATEIGYPVAAALIASIYLRYHPIDVLQLRSRSAKTTVTITGFLTLVALRKRALFAVTTLTTVAVSYLFRGRRSRGELALQLALTVLVVAVLASALGVDIAGGLLPVATRGQDAEQLAELNGRLPLWDYLWAEGMMNPISGVGFGAYWTPQAIDSALVAVQWPAVVAHNGFLDEWLATGAIGLLLQIGFWAVALASTIRAGLGNRDEFAVLAAAWISMFLMFNLTSSLIQNWFSYPFILAIVALFTFQASSEQPTTVTRSGGSRSDRAII